LLKERTRRRCRGGIRNPRIWT